MMRRDADSYAGSITLRPDAADVVQPRRRRSARNGPPLSGTQPVGTAAHASARRSATSSVFLGG
jgi:hypothetical protein